MEIGFLDLSLILGYLLLMLYLGYRGWRMSRTSTDYLLAGRRLGYGMYTGCLAAVVLGGASTVGGAKLGYQYGVSGIWMVFMIGLGVMALGAFLTTRLSNLGVVSISEMLELRYNEHARWMSAVIMASYAAMIAVIQVIATGTILSAAAGWGMTGGVLIGGAVVLSYTFLGGMWSVSLTDSIQFVLMTIGIFFLLLPGAWVSAGGWKNLSASLPASYFRLDSIGYGSILSFFLLFFFGLLIGQDIWQRVFTARDARVARRGTVIAGFYCLLYAMATALIGMAARVRFPELDDPQQAFARAAVEVLPTGVSGIVLAASLSALMSTASGPLLASSTLVANDIYRRFFTGPVSDLRFLRTSRRLTAVIGAAVIACALWLQDVIQALDVAYTLLSGSLFVPIFAGFFWKRANGAGTLVSMCLSAAAAIAAMVVWGIGSTPPILVGLGTSLTALIAASLLTAPTPADRLSRWEERLKGATLEARAVEDPPLSSKR